ncbi:MAG: diaminopimelate epimerase [Acidobacteriota bacterium]
MPLLGEFFKMSAGGNDFIVLDNRAGTLRVESMGEDIRRLCARALSVGADGVILLEPSPRAHLRARFFNPDGRPTFCGNGGRCAARLAYLQGMAPTRMTMESDRMVHHAAVRGVEVVFEMPEPKGFDDAVEVEVLGETIRGTLVDTGVPHFVVFRALRSDESIDSLGRALRSHPRFAPSGVNVDFVQAWDRGTLSVRTFERGVEGETLACGTGCVAAALAAAASGKTTGSVSLLTRSGEPIRVRYEGDPRRPSGVHLEGQARLIYVGQLTEESTGGFAPAR